MRQDFMKVIKCIKTSETRGQFKSCERLIKLFENKFCYGRKTKSEGKILVKELIQTLSVHKSHYNIYI